MKKILKSFACILLATTSCQKNNSIDESEKQSILVYKYFEPSEYDSDYITPISYNDTKIIDSIFILGTEVIEGEVYQKTVTKRFNPSTKFKYDIGSSSTKTEFKREVGEKLIILSIDTISITNFESLDIKKYIDNYNINNSTLNLIASDEEAHKLQLIKTTEQVNAYKVGESKLYFDDIPEQFVENTNSQKTIVTENNIEYNCNKYLIGHESYEHASTLYYKDEILVQFNVTSLYQGRVSYKKELSEIIKN